MIREEKVKLKSMINYSFSDLIRESFLHRTFVISSVRENFFHETHIKHSIRENFFRENFFPFKVTNSRLNMFVCSTHTAAFTIIESSAIKKIIFLNYWIFWKA